MFTKKLPLFVLAFALLASSAVHAQATRTWVSGVGDDANPCSRTAPCKTFAGAISKTAAKGEINVLDPGGFGGVTITKSISIIGNPFMAGVLVSGTNAIIINAAATDVVTLRGLSIQGLGTGLDGIRVLAAKEVHVEDCTITGFANRGIMVNNTANNVNLYVENTIIRNNVGAAAPGGNSGAILLRPVSPGTASALIEDSHLDQNTFGLRVEANARATMNGGTTSGNTSFGIHAISTTTAASIIAENVTSSNNTTGVAAEGSANASVRISNMLVTSNSTGLTSITGGQIISFVNNSVAGNGNNTVPAVGVPTSTSPQI
ncbi:MAG: NosD domain-containing protein [Acidobacteriota bacterium]